MNSFAKVSAISILGIGLFAIVVWWNAAHPLRSAKNTLEVFYTHPGAEDTLKDPLILSGNKVAPLVIEEIINKQMPRRRYAIGYLGDGEYRDALPALINILADNSEKDYFRGDALVSIYKIDRSEGTGFAHRYKGRDDYLGRTASEVIEDSEYVNSRRSYLMALWGRHE